MPAKKSSPRRSSPRRSPVLKAVRETEYLVNDVDAEPSKEIFNVMNMLGYLFVVLALASGISWLYYIAKADEKNDFGTDSARTRQDTYNICFQGTVVSALLYFASRHHFRKLHH